MPRTPWLPHPCLGRPRPCRPPPHPGQVPPGLEGAEPLPDSAGADPWAHNLRVNHSSPRGGGGRGHGHPGPQPPSGQWSFWDHWCLTASSSRAQPGPGGQGCGEEGQPCPGPARRSTQPSARFPRTRVTHSPHTTAGGQREREPELQHPPRAPVPAGHSLRHEHLLGVPSLQTQCCSLLKPGPYSRGHPQPGPAEAGARQARRGSRPEGHGRLRQHTPRPAAGRAGASPRSGCTHLTPMPRAQPAPSSLP